MRRHSTSCQFTLQKGLVLTMPNENGQLVLEWSSPGGASRTGTIVARFGNEAYTDRPDVCKAKSVSNLQDVLCERWPALREPDRRQALERKLQVIAANEASRTNQEEDEAMQRRRGLIDPRAEKVAIEGRRPLKEHLADFRKSLEAKGDTPEHVDLTLVRLTRTLESCGVE